MDQLALRRRDVDRRQPGLGTRPERFVKRCVRPDQGLGKVGIDLAPPALIRQLSSPLSPGSPRTHVCSGATGLASRAMRQRPLVSLRKMLIAYPDMRLG